MLSTVLRSERAEKVNLLIIDTFVALNTRILTHKDLLLEMEAIRKKVSGQDEKIEFIFNHLKQFLKQKESPGVKIGFKT
jgi:uncharacterized membrane protein